jgi:hypothetical protein
MQLHRLEFNEIERIAYITGHPLVAMCADHAFDGELLEDGLDDQLEAAENKGFEEGKIEGMGLDTAETIAGLESNVIDLKASHRRCRDNLQAVCDWLRSDDSKTVKSRQAFEKRLLAALHSTHRY